ncbi:MAG: DUF2924 domain-containing protein, partial [Roseomonas sp.]|nr:DUF2924 domain-containing protein [Roseomonas sp.]
MKQRPLTKKAPADPDALKISPAQVLPRLAALRTAPIADLKEQWRMLYGKEPPAFSRSYIESRLAYRIQELAYGGLRPETRTQSFNTTTSMGRLTLNILLSFAQFEREVIGERIRDKVAASKARGMWMGGKVPLGYEVANRKLVVNEAEAKSVRQVFGFFAETASGTETVQRLQAKRVTSKSGRLLNKGDVYKILNLRSYVGEVEHKGRIYPGEHQAIVPRALWNKVHALLQTSPRARVVQNRRHQTALLKGLIFGLDGRALSPTHSRKKGRMYRYYVAQRVLKHEPT